MVVKGLGKCWVDEKDRLRVGRLIVFVLAVVVVVGYVFACGIAQSVDEQRDHWWWQLWSYRFDHEGAWFDVARTTATLVAIPGAAVALVIAFARHRVSERQVEHAIAESLAVQERELVRQESTDKQLEHAAAEARSLEARELDRRINEQYVRAVDQLRDEAAVARIAGMHALDRLAQDQAELRSIVVDVWCAYLRIPTTSGSGVDLRGEQEVRATCARLLLGHLVPEDEDRSWVGESIRIDLADADLTNYWDARGRHFPIGADFSRATFGIGPVFAGATIHGVKFGHAIFGDYADFEGAQFGDNARLWNANFGVRASFSNARFGQATWLDGARLGDDASFAGAIFGDATDFNGAVFGDDADFDGAVFGKSTSFVDVSFGPGARLAGATFDGEANFDNMSLGAESSDLEDEWPGLEDDEFQEESGDD